MSSMILRKRFGDRYSPDVKRNGRTAAVWVADCLCEPRCRTSAKPSRPRMLTTSLGLRIGSFGTSTYPNELCPDKLCFDLRLSIFEEHSQHFAQIRVQLVKRFGLRVRTRKAGDKPDEQPCFGRALHDCRVGLHLEEINTPGPGRPDRRAVGGTVQSQPAPAEAAESPRPAIRPVQHAQPSTADQMKR